MSPPWARTRSRAIASPRPVPPLLLRVRAASYLRAVRSTFGRVVTPDGTSTEASAKRSKEGFRPDVEGLSAVAVGAVLLYHAGVPFAPGGYVGVDVFFVISGFLITGLLVRELESRGTVSLARFYSRRAKRLLPLTVVVLGVVVLLSWLLFDPVRIDEVHIYSAGLRREYRECDEWRKQILDRIVKQEHPDLVVTSSLPTYRPREDGRRLRGDAGEEAMVDGYVSTLEKLRTTGAPVVLIEDVPHPDKNVPECVSRSLDHLERCAFPKNKALGFPPVNSLAAARVEGVQLIDPTPMVCPEMKCPSVIGDALVYRNGSHLTATYVRTLTPWLGKQLPEPAG
jgi:hypothetical protein